MKIAQSVMPTASADGQADA
ncbi:protein of unknown function [Propionibacterium freudenreichii]|nr:protein of unknown function [Propionibacterium freudenreichii]CEH00568.1 Protein of unknown function [Propionibacterium freudenreichii]